ncbi:SDR family NAD(P)-dependent oxidoreductase [Methylovirgula sp. 4M-Z18]|uniref:SDR family NAD(P)-dependent oxidoreductase n=1 Tax=Methylovirgula sp. 4M-Z18 TaxID=2293567 RepID=UPI000E2F3352|nr:SDR family NAD(P)-dependent oxidoreductase [Methylovirgula sp. 4M-Z18]RFB77982.1 SDR family NAD(P)-dependent oxidoreductase [Methylovirgula sp. 4M-Z18]
MADNQIILITGATDGVGRRVAERLARPGCTLLIHGRDRQRAEQLLATIAQAGGTGKFYPADLSSLAEVRELAAAIQRDHRRIDGFISNAGIGTGGGRGDRQLSRDRFELRFAVNYLAGFALTRLLLPLIQASENGRIVQVASAGQQAIDFDDVMLERGYSGNRAYCQSKLAQIMFTFDLAQELQHTPVVAHCLHPASYMDTTMVRQSGIAPMSSVEEGADAILHALSVPLSRAKSGTYFNGRQPARAHAQAYDSSARRRLRALSHEWTQIPLPQSLS